VAFTMDVDGLLSVTAKELQTGKVAKVEIEAASGLPPAELERLISAHAR